MLVKDLVEKLLKLNQDQEIGFGEYTKDYLQSTDFIKNFKVSEEVVWKYKNTFSSDLKVDFKSSIEDYSQDGDYEVSMKYVIHTN